MANAADSNAITRAYLDSLLVETRYMDAAFPDTGMTLYGQKFATPVMTAALSHLDHFMFPGAADALARGAAAAGAVLWYGMAEEAEIERLAAVCPNMIEIVKPYADRELVWRKLRHAEACHLLAVGIDIDHAFGPDGGADVVDRAPMAPLTTAELRDFASAIHLPLIVKGVLSLQDAQKSLEAGAGGLLLSHHNNRMPAAVPPLMQLPAILEAVNGAVPVFVDDEIASGLDAYRALALGASAVGVGRPLMTAIREDPVNGAAAWLQRATAELRKIMAGTGVRTLADMDPSVIHRRCF